MATRKTRVATLTSVVVVGGLEPVGPREDLGQLRRIVDQDGKVLGADKEPRTFVLERNQGNLV